MSGSVDLLNVLLHFASGTRGQGVNNYEAYMLATRPFE